MGVGRPLRLLKERADAVGQGDFSARERIRSQDEIGDFARAFDDMAQKVAATQVALQDRVATKTRELARAARYADLGVLAAGIAHEINNPLATIATCAEGMQRRMDRGTLERGHGLLVIGPRPACHAPHAVADFRDGPTGPAERASAHGGSWGGVLRHRMTSLRDVRMPAASSRSQ